MSQAEDSSDDLRRSAEGQKIVFKAKAASHSTLDIQAGLKMDRQDLDGLARQWLGALRQAHLSYVGAAESYDRLGRFMGVLAASLSTVVGTAIFASINESVDIRLRLVGGLLSLLAGALGAAYTFLNLPQIAERHRVVAVVYSGLRRDIEQCIVLGQFDRLPGISTRWNEAEDMSLPIPGSVRRRVLRNIAHQDKAEVARQGA